MDNLATWFKSFIEDIYFDSIISVLEWMQRFVNQGNQKRKKLEVVKTSKSQKFINLQHTHKMKYYVAIENYVFSKSLHFF